MTISPFSALHALKRNLPFRLDAIEEVNALYLTWRRRGRDEDGQTIDLWTYCFIWRYLLVKFTRDSTLNEVDLDMLLGRIYEQVVGKRNTLHQTDRYASWVSVVCHNQFVNHRRVGHPDFLRGAPPEDARIEQPSIQDGDVVVLYRAFMQALDRLPEYLREMIELRVIHERSYEEIVESTGKNVVVVRSYISRALQRLRNDADFVAFCQYHFDEESTKEGMPDTLPVSE